VNITKNFPQFSYLLIIAFFFSILLHGYFLFLSSNPQNSGEIAQGVKKNLPILNLRKETKQSLTPKDFSPKISKIPRKTRKKRKPKNKTNKKVATKQVPSLSTYSERPRITQALLPPSIRKNFYSKSQLDMDIELPENIPEELKTKLKDNLGAFYRRISRRFYNSVFDTYLEHERFYPSRPIPVNTSTDSVALRVTYDKFGNVVRVQTLLAGKYKIHNTFWDKAITSISSIPNPPKILLDSKKEFSVIYSLSINQ